MDPLAWATLLMLGGLLLAVAEVFVPSGGILGCLSIFFVLSAVGMAFYRGPWYGLSFLGAAVVGLPAALATALKWWPQTPMGRRVLLEVPRSEDVLPDNQEIRALKSLVGQVGQAKSLMLPSGAVNIGGRTVDALSEGMAIEKGEWVKVVEVRGTRVVVRPTQERPRPADPNDPLSQPIDSLGLDGFEKPLS